MKRSDVMRILTNPGPVLPPLALGVLDSCIDDSRCSTTSTVTTY